MSCCGLELKLLCASPEQREDTASSAQAGFAVMFLLTLIAMHLFNLPCSW